MRFLLILCLIGFCVFGGENSELAEMVTEEMLDEFKEELKPKLSKEEVHRKLLGKWKSNKELTMRFVDERAKLPKEQSLLLQNLVGQLQLTYKESSMTTLLPKSEQSLDDKYLMIEDFTYENLYKVIGFTDNTLVIESETEELGKIITTVVFVDEDTYWIYLSGELFDIHAREYFTRVKE